MSGKGPVPRRYRRIVGPERRRLVKDVVERYAEGENIRALAASTGCSYGTIHRLLAESGVQIRSRGGSRPGRPGTFRSRRPEGDLTRESALILQARLARGMTQHDLAAKAGVSESTVSRAETGQARVMLRTLEQLVDAAGFKLLVLLVDKDGGVVAGGQP